MSYNSVNLQVYIGIVYVFLIFYCIGIVIYYAEPGFPWHTYVTLVIGYYISFGIILLVPLDIATCVIDRRDANGSGGDSAYNRYLADTAIIAQAYNVFFTLILLWGSLVLVYEEYYNTDGYFTVIGRLANSFWRMIRDIILMVIAGIIVLGILIGQKVVSGTDALLLAAVITTNAVYEFFLMFLIAYGLIEFPRAIWNESNLEYSLLLTQMKATYDYKEISDYKINIQEEISKVKYFKDRMNKASPSANLKYAIEVLESDCPEDFKSERKSDTESINKYLDKGGQVTVHGLALLRSDLNVNKDKYKMAQSKVLATEQRAYLLEDLVECRKQRRSLIFWTLKNKESTKFEYLWFIYLRPILYKIVAIFFLMLSVFSILGVVCSMAGVPNETSPYFLATHNAETGSAIVIFIWFSMGYTCYVALWSLFQIRLSGFVELVPFRTSPESLSFNTRMCIRLAAPLAFFYLGWIAENGLKTGSWVEFTQYITTTVPVYNQTVTNSTIPNNSTQYIDIQTPQTVLMLSAFSRFYNIQAVPIIKSLFGTGFPIILFILLPLFLTNSFNRMFIMCKMSNMQFGTPIPTDEELAEGKKQLAKFKKIAARSEQRSTLRSHLLSMSQAKKANSSFSFFSKDDENGDATGTSASILVEPDELVGQIEKKVGNRNFEKMQVEVGKDGKLYYKDISKSKSKSKETDLGNTDLRTVTNILVSTDVKNDGNSCLILETNNETLKFKYKTEEEMIKWKSLLALWKTYAIDSDKLNFAKGGNSPQKSRPKFESKFDENLYDLDNIIVDDVEEVDRSSTWFKAFGFGLKKEDINEKNDNDVAVKVEEKPPKLKGFLEKKGKGTFGTSEWQKIYCRVDEMSCNLLYSKSKEYDEDESGSGSIDLREVTNISMNSKPSKDSFSRFDIDTGERVYKFKAKSKVEAENWVANLNLWREYFLLQMT